MRWRSCPASKTVSTQSPEGYRRIAVEETFPITEVLDAIRDLVERPRCRDRLDQAHHEAPCFFAVVGESIRILEDRQVRGHPFERLSDQVGVLDRLQRYETPAMAPTCLAHIPAQLTT